METQEGVQTVFLPATEVHDSTKPIVAVQQAAKKALAAYIKYPNGANYRALTALLLQIQQAYIAEFDIGSK